MKILYGMANNGKIDGDIVTDMDAALASYDSAGLPPTGD
jgi:hypothetical protein